MIRNKILSFQTKSFWTAFLEFSILFLKLFEFRYSNLGFNISSLASSTTLPPNLTRVTSVRLLPYFALRKCDPEGSSALFGSA
jgi:hypothetical protein